MSKKLTDCPSNLKEAIDWILRVTGKDGQDTNDQGARAINALSAEVQTLLNQVKDFGPEIKIVTDALNTNSGNGGLITKLADGLRQFIGYEDGTIKYATHGIGMSNDPLERIKDGILVFVYGMVKNLEKYVQNAQVAIGTIMKGKTNFNDAVQNELILSAISGSDFNSVLNAVKRVTDFKGKSDFQTLAETFKTYLGKVLQAVVDDNEVGKAQMTTPSDVKQLVTDLKSNFETVVDALKTQNAKQPIDFGKKELKQHIDAIYENKNGTFKKLYDAVNPKKAQIRDAKAKDLVNAAYHAASYSLNLLQRGYKSSYQGAEWSQLNTNGNHTTCAKIFLACLPLIISNLGQLFWKCKQDKAHGGWKQMQLDGKGQSGNEGSALKDFMDLMTFSSVRLNGAMTGDNIVSNAFKDFNEFTNAASAQSYAQFLNKFKTTGIEKWKANNQTAKEQNYFSGLYLCSSWYFQGCQAKVTQTRPPSSIREMLYWLMGLTATPQFGDLLGHIQNVVGPDFKVAVSGSSNKNETLSADQVTSYILSTCYTTPSVLNVIQGSVPPKESND
ncbi:variant erythrocyte surface antigen-1 family protein [Babesia caballi]|uniref:Variant erythrocyte surface antigen-1 family protein n=1 Tax=Babesia caballi TaxID=5871 RepID=A0AAV4LLC9_BABCB|nr:variant erythrocyte surface antigen-1 family protein [Babesia caballi]